MSVLVEESCDEVIDKVINEIFSQLFQDLGIRKVANELSENYVSCDMHQGNKVGSSAAGELSRSKDNFAINTFPDGVDLMNKLLNIVIYFEASPTNRKNYDKFLQDHSRDI